MTKLRVGLLSLGSGLLLLAGCGGSSSREEGQAAVFTIEQVSNGFGQLLPHTTFRLGPDNQPTAQILSIRTRQDLLANVRRNNPVRPTPTFDPGTLLPGGLQGNHFVYVTFTEPLDVDSVLSPAPGQAGASGLTGSITVTAFDPAGGTSVPILGRAFVDGKTYAGPALGSPPQLELQTWLTRDPSSGLPIVNPTIDNNLDGVPDGLGFPGTQSVFEGANQLVSPNTFVFVIDGDADLRSHEAFPSARQIRIQIATSVRSTSGKPLVAQALVSTTVGSDLLQPEVLVTPPPTSSPLVVPGLGQTGVDPLTDIRVSFTEPIQPWTVGDLPIGVPPNLSPAIRVSFGPDTARVDMPFHVLPASVFDLSTYILSPAFNFPGEGPQGNECGLFNRVRVDVNSAQFRDLAGNQNSISGGTFFDTGPGPGLVNAPVAPEAIYIGRSGFEAGISVIDLNGFGGGTGDPTFDPSFQNTQETDTNFPNNTNLRFQGSLLIPALVPGTCTINGGSAGTYTLTRDSTLSDLVVRAPLLLQVTDMHLGWALDRTFNNGPVPFGCQSGGGNLCAVTGLKRTTVAVTSGTLNPNATQQGGAGVVIDGAPNLITWSPHPNPPPLRFPPLCISPFLVALEPTSIDTTLPPPAGPGLINLLVPGDALGNPLNGVPPSGLLAEQPTSFFDGPSAPQENLTNCQNFTTRQQVGQFLYVLDRAAREVVVLNSNRMTVIDRIPVPDPTSAAIGTNLTLLAVTNQSVDTVTFIDINPSSATFHQIVKTTSVGRSPRGIAWEPGNEDVLVCNELDNTMSIISCFSLEVRKVVGAFLDRPFEVAITPRQINFGFQRNVYFAYVLNRSGRVAVYESGPNAVNGWGYDNFVGTVTETFLSPKTIQADPTDLRSAFWVLHQGPIDLATGQPGVETEGAVSRCVVESAITGQLPLNVQSLLIPQFRDMFLRVQLSIGQDRISGIPVDLAFDNLLNIGGLQNFATSFSAGSALIVNGKSLVRGNPGQSSSSPRYLFLAIPSPTSGQPVVDVVRLDGAFQRVDTSKFRPGVNSIPVGSASVLMDYFRQ